MKPKLRFADFSDDYIESKLKNYVEVYDGTHETPNYVDSGVKFVSVENIKNLLNSDKYIPEIDFDKYKIKPKYNDVFMTRIGDIGTSTIYKSNEPLAYYVSLNNSNIAYEELQKIYIDNLAIIRNELQNNNYYSVEFKYTERGLINSIIITGTINSLNEGK